MAPRIDHVREHAAGSAEDIIFQDHPFVDRDVVLDLYVVAQTGAGHDHDVLPQVAALTVDRPGHDVAEMPDLGAAANDGAVIDVSGLVSEVVGHSGEK